MPKTSKKKTKKKASKKASKKKDVSLFDAIKGKMKKSKAIKMSNKSDSLIPWRVPFKHLGLQKATGGLLGGKIMMIEGFSQTGKSFLGYELGAGAMKMGGMFYLQDREQAYEPDYGAKAGLADDQSFFYDDKITIEDSFQEWVDWIKAVREVIKDKSVPVVVMDDSFAVSRCLEQEESDEKGKTLGYGAMKKNNSYYDKLMMLQPLLQEYAVSLIIINQLTEDKSGGMFVDPTKRKGPQLEYFCSQILRGKKGNKLVTIRKINSSERKVQVGMTSNWQTIKNRFVEPMKKINVEIYFRSGLKRISGFADFLILEGIVKQKSIPDPDDGRKKIKSFLYDVDGEEVFFDNIKKLIKERPEVLEPAYTAKLEEVPEGDIVAEEYESETEQIND